MRILNPFDIKLRSYLLELQNLKLKFGVFKIFLLFVRFGSISGREPGLTSLLEYEIVFFDPQPLQVLTIY